jgi:type IV pilus assembly protein PilC
MSSNAARADRDVRDFIAHQLALEIGAGTPADAAAERLRGAMPQEFHWAIDEAMRVLAGGAPPASWPQLGNLLAAARDRGIDVARAFAAYIRSVEQTRTAVAGVFAGATSLGIYLVTMSLIFIVVVSVYAVLVLPAFRTLFESFGAPLPAFTQLIVGNTAVLLVSLALLVLVLVLYMVGITRLKSRMEQMQPLMPALRWFPALKYWARAHDTSLWMRFYALFLDAGAPVDTAEAAAAQLAGAPEGDHRPRLLAGAAKLGHLREELARLIEANAREAVDRFEGARNTVVLVLRLFIYMLLSGYVLAMYLPIFKLGAVV